MVGCQALSQAKQIWVISLAFYEENEIKKKVDLGAVIHGLVHLVFWFVFLLFWLLFSMKKKLYSMYPWEGKLVAFVSLLLVV